MRFDLQRIPRSVIYLVLLICLAVPFFVKWSLPVYVSNATRCLYRTVEKVHAEKPNVPVVLLSSWDPSSRGENRPQMVALVRHLLILKQPFVVFCPALNPMAPRASEEVINSELERGHYSLKYGVDYANLGFKGISGPNIGPILQNLEGDFLGCVAQDLYGTSAYELPILKGFKSLANASMIITISGDVESEHVIGIFSPRHPEIPVGAAGWSLICTRLYPYFDTRQLVGILDGMNGASEYLTLLKENYPELAGADSGEEENESGGSSTRVNALTLARVLIILLIALGNIGMLLERRRERLGLPVKKTAPSVTVGEKRYLNIGALIFTILFIIALLGEFTLRSKAGTWSVAVFGEWVAVFCTIGMLSFIFGDNKLYRTLEHVIIGSSAAYMLFEVIDKQILPSFVYKVADGFAAMVGRPAQGSAWQLLLLLGLIPSALWFTVYIKKLAWTNKLVLGLLMGVAVGIAFGQNVNLAIPQIAGAVKPLLTFGPVNVPHISLMENVSITWKNVFNLVYLVTMVLVMIYFVFCLKMKTTVAKGAVRSGRIVMMIAFGAVFGNTIATRMSWLIDRIDAVALWIRNLMILGG
ncbi:hypothetical protein IJS98_04805 [bacterium]|nr:hypothetical protein [bacterium]